MRILMTEKGEAELSSLTAMPPISNKPSKRANRKSKRKIVSKMDLKKKITDTDIYFSVGHKDNSLSEAEMSQAIPINIKQKKPNIPKKAADLYNSYRNESEVNLEGNNLKLNSTRAKNQCKLRNIISKNAYEQIRKEMITKDEVKRKNAMVNSTNFRTNYQEKTNLTKLEEALDKEISPERVNLIKYINKKDKIGTAFISKLTRLNPREMHKMNKISQIMFYENEQEKIFKDILTKKIVNKKIYEKNQHRRRMEQFGIEMEEGAVTLERFNKTFSRKDRFFEKHAEMTQKFWTRVNFSRPFNTTTRFFTKGTERMNTFESTKD